MTVLSLAGALAIGVTSPAAAATIGPDAFGYTASDTAIAFENISGSGTRVLVNTDDSSVLAAMGFNFNMYGAAFSNAFISTNGLITFGGSNTTFTNQSLASTSVSNGPAIAALWDDWVTTGDGADAVYYETRGGVGNRRFIVQWNSMFVFGGSPETVTFEAILYEASGNILFNYVDTTSGDAHASGGSATVGIQDVNGNTNGRNLQWSFNQQQESLRSGQAILISSTPVPEPATLVLLGTGLLVAARLRRRS